MVSWVARTVSLVVRMVASFAMALPPVAVIDRGQSQEVASVWFWFLLSEVLLSIWLFLHGTLNSVDMRWQSQEFEQQCKTTSLHCGCLLVVCDILKIYTSDFFTSFFKIKFIMNIFISLSNGIIFTLVTHTKRVFIFSGKI